MSIYVIQYEINALLTILRKIITFPYQFGVVHSSYILTNKYNQPCSRLSYYCQDLTLEARIPFIFILLDVSVPYFKHIQKITTLS